MNAPDPSPFQMRRALPKILLLTLLTLPHAAAQAPAEVALDMETDVVEIRQDLPARLWVTVTGRVRCEHGADPPPDLELYVGQAEDGSGSTWQVAPSRFTIPWRSAGGQVTAPPLMPPTGFHDWEIREAVNATAAAGPDARDEVLDNRWVVPARSTGGPECTPQGLHYDATSVEFQMVVHSPSDPPTEADTHRSLLSAGSAGPPVAGAALIAAIGALFVAVLLQARQRLG